jgi:hypothetical protein
MDAFKNISISENAMKYVNRFLCGCQYVTVWDDEWLETCQPCAITLSYCTRVNMRGELYCPPGQEPTKQADGTYGCGLCPQQKYSLDKSLDTCNFCPQGSVCDREGTVVPYAEPGYWRKNPWSVQEFFYEPYDRQYEFDFDTYFFHKCKNAFICKGGKNSTCEYGHWSGAPMCAVCMPKWYTTMGRCIECGEQKAVAQLLVLTGVMVGLAATIFTAWFLAVDLRSDISDEKEESKDESASASRATKLKMLLSYTQVFGSSDSTMEIPWPPEFIALMDSVRASSSLIPWICPC